MRIAVVTACTSTFPNYRLDMVKEFVKRGCDVVVIGDEPEDKWQAFFANLTIRYRSYGISRNGFNPIKDIRAKAELKRIFIQEQVDTVWTYQAKPNIYGCLAAYEVGIDRIFAMMGGLGSIFRGNDFKSRCIKGLVAKEYKAAFKHAVKVFFQNRDDVELFKRLGIVTDNQVVMTKGSGVNVEEFPHRALPDSPVYLFVGRLVRGKGIIEFLEASRMVRDILPNARFMVVGAIDDNPTSIKLEDLQPYISDGTVEYYGEQKDVRPFLERSSVFVLPSYYGEGTPKSGLEAMATGRPLIVADAVGSREVVIDGVNGLLVRPKDASDLASKMLEIVEDNERMKKMAKSSRMRAESEFNVDIVNQVICESMAIQ